MNLTFNIELCDCEIVVFGVDAVNQQHSTKTIQILTGQKNCISSRKKYVFVWWFVRYFIFGRKSNTLIANRYVIMFSFSGFSLFSFYFISFDRDWMPKIWFALQFSHSTHQSNTYTHCIYVFICAYITKLCWWLHFYK